MISIKAKEILDSRGNPTVEAELTYGSAKFLASMPSGVSTGKYEAVELRDKDGKGVKKAIENIEKIIAPALAKEDFLNQKKIDEVLIKLDGTKNKSRLGANAILVVSIAVCRLGAKAKKLALYSYLAQLAGESSSFKNIPKPSFNMIEGGKHGEAGLAFQEFMVIPQKETFQENLKAGKAIYQALKKILEKKFGKKNVRLSAEGAFAPPVKRISEALDFISEAGERAGQKDNFKIALDAASSEFFESNYYKAEGNFFSKKELLGFYESLTKKYPIISIEDPFQENDFESFAGLRKSLKTKAIIFGDDLTASNAVRMEQARKNKSISGLILKPNQIGTVTETLEAAKLAKDFGWKIMVSNRAGETGDDFIADLAVGINADFIKSGAPFPKERMAKYNRLLKIEQEIKNG
ncbi:MAG: phosphopyruvate hydratase [Candidatus Nealsonbacteria bacterium]|nr:phosphopyruvate hydratase [Candidatus Nealsonbacteria bacterium]